jgi:hypothetical protein
MMFDLFKDIDKYKGIPPYASELYGVYQPLLGWKSNLTKKWIQHGGILIDPQIQSILDAYIKPGPKRVEGALDEMFTVPFEPGSGHGNSPYSVLLTKDLNSELLNIIRDRVQAFVERDEGRLPEGPQWATVVNINEMLDANVEELNDNILRQVHKIHRARLLESMRRQDENWMQKEALIAAAKAELLKVMQYESQIATFLLFYAEAQIGLDPNELKKLFFVQKAPPISEILRPSDPLASINPRDEESGALSPVGFVHLFRQYFFDLGTFLGEPVEHIWLAPGATIELVEISTRRQIIERTLEQMIETTMRSERASTLKDEISNATKQANENSTKLGVSQSNTANLYVYQGTVSAEFGIEATLSSSRETAHKQNREQSENLSNEIKQSFKSVFRTVTETTDTTSRRHVITNPSPNLINYDLRRKMRRVGVQVQDIGTRLCWQVFIDEPGTSLGLSNLVHIAKPADLTPQPNQKETPYPPRLPKGFELEVVWLAADDPRFPDPTKGYIPLATFLLPAQPDSGYEIEKSLDGRVNLSVKSYSGRDFQGPPFALTGTLVGANQIEVGVLSGPKGIKWNRNVNFVVTGELVFVPNADTKKDIDAANAKIKQDGKTAKREEERLAKEAFFKAAKERIELASEVKPRPSWDLREEERTVVYRELIQRLMLDSWEAPDPEANRRLSHVRSEIVRALFDVDSMLYFVAPEWWMPRKHYSQFIGKSPVKQLGKTRPSYSALGNEVVVNWSDSEARPDNYYITDKSRPAKLGSSLGWLLQLDGDNLRNAFLNAPWVKAVIPIRPGREKAAINWLRAAVEGDDGWNTDYLGTEPEFAGKKMGEVLDIIADRLARENSDIKNVLKADKVFEKGFDHLASGFDAGLEPHEVFSQWISILPTDQIVAVEYQTTDLVVPDE